MVGHDPCPQTTSLNFSPDDTKQANKKHVKNFTEGKKNAPFCFVLFSFYTNTVSSYCILEADTIFFEGTPSCLQYPEGITRTRTLAGLLGPGRTMTRI